MWPFEIKWREKEMKTRMKDFGRAINHQRLMRICARVYVNIFMRDIRIRELLHGHICPSIFGTLFSP